MEFDLWSSMTKSPLKSPTVDRRSTAVQPDWRWLNHNLAEFRFSDATGCFDKAMSVAD
jgi:hypothetical protein